MTENEKSVETMNPDEYIEHCMKEVPYSVEKRLKRMIDDLKEIIGRFGEKKGLTKGGKRMRFTESKDRKDFYAIKPMIMDIIRDFESALDHKVADVCPELHRIRQDAIDIDNDPDGWIEENRQ